jgi:Zn2+/Cd2+-exporting ATPase
VEAADDCIDWLTEALNNQKGIEQAHIVREKGTAELCLHYDPNRISLTRVQRLAEEAGAELTTFQRLPSELQ